MESLNKKLTHLQICSCGGESEFIVSCGFYMEKEENALDFVIVVYSMLV